MVKKGDPAGGAGNPAGDSAGGAANQAGASGGTGAGNQADASGGNGVPAGGDGDPLAELLFMIGNVQASIFDYEVAHVSNNIVSIFSQIVSGGAVDTANPQALAKLNQLMGECLAAMQSSDYLLLADLLEYRLKPLIGREPAAAAKLRR
ncbi:MAG: hypothetical protein LBJ10_04255 [Clostridiales bacterium]|nr:hypothetical protein [Clostridiales bacterium]